MAGKRKKRASPPRKPPKKSAKQTAEQKRRSEAAKKGARTRKARIAEKLAKRKRAAQKAAETRRLKALEKKRRATEREAGGLRRRAAGVARDVRDRAGDLGRHLFAAGWGVASRRIADNQAVALLYPPEGAPTSPHDTAGFPQGGRNVQARYDRTRAALTPRAGRTPEANLRSLHRIWQEDGTWYDVWQTLVSLTGAKRRGESDSVFAERVSGSFIGAFDDAWEDIATTERFRGGVLYEGPVIAFEVYFVEHDNK